MRSVPVSRLLITTVAPDIPASAASLTDPQREESPCANVERTSSPPASNNPSTKRKIFFEEKLKLSRELICTLQFLWFCVLRVLKTHALQFISKTRRGPKWRVRERKIRGFNNNSSGKRERGTWVWQREPSP